MFNKETPITGERRPTSSPPPTYTVALLFCTKKNGRSPRHQARKSNGAATPPPALRGLDGAEEKS